MGPKPTLLFFGATGGCALAALTLSLQAGYTCTALVRTPSKLSTLLSTRSVPQENLKLIQGDAKDPAAVAQALPGASIIIFCIGGAPKFTPNPFRPTLDDPVVCQTAIKTIISCLEEMRGSAGALWKAPVLAAISSIGLDKEVDDLPLALWPLYKLMLPIPHGDKKAMEDAIVAAPQGLLEYVIVRAGMFTDGAVVGENGVRAGYVGREKKNDGRWGDVEGVAKGYTISRGDVGGFLFEEVVKREGGEWKGKMVSLVY